MFPVAPAIKNSSVARKIRSTGAVIKIGKKKKNPLLNEIEHYRRVVGRSASFPNFFRFDSDNYSFLILPHYQYSLEDGLNVRVSPYDWDCLKRLRLSRQLFKALIHLQERLSILHLDVKPSNLMLTSNGLRLVLVDFGMARSYLKPTKIAHSIGTAYYMSPDMHERTITKLCDFESALYVMFELLGATLPWKRQKKCLVMCKAKHRATYYNASICGCTFLDMDVHSTFKDFVKYLLKTKNPKPYCLLVLLQRLMRETNK